MSNPGDGSQVSLEATSFIYSHTKEIYCPLTRDMAFLTLIRIIERDVGDGT
jgi:hypothetical protein